MFASLGHATSDSGHQFPPSVSHAAPAHDSGTKGAARGLHSRHAKGTSHDMSDPAMAASMEANFRTRFWVALVLSALVVLISPMGEALGIRLPLSAAFRSWC